MNGSVEGLVLAGMSRRLQVLFLFQEVWQIRPLSVLDFEVMIIHRCLQVVQCLHLGGA